MNEQYFETTPRVRYLDKRQLMVRYGVDKRTIDRWRADPSLSFPKPLTINQTILWDEDDLIAFERELKGDDQEQEQD